MVTDQAPVPLSIFRSNSKFYENSERFSLNILDRSQRYFAHVTAVTLSWRVQNIVVIGRVYLTLDCFEFSSNFEFDRNMLSGTGARSRPNWITGSGPKSGSAGKSESRGPESGVSRWRRPNLDICSQNYHFGLFYDVIYQFLGKEL